MGDGTKARFGDDHMDALSTMSSLAIIYQHQEQYVKSQCLGKQALEFKSRLLGPRNPFTLRTAHELAINYELQGRYEEAERLYIRVLNDPKFEVGNTGWADGLDVFQSLARLYTLQRRFEEAEYLLNGTLRLEAG